MAVVDFSRYKRIVQYFWDPEPTNIEDSESPVWCLGRQYVLPTSKFSASYSHSDIHSHTIYPEATKEQNPDQDSLQAVTPARSFGGGIDSHSPLDKSAAISEDGGWPLEFLDDFESRLWFSYRSGFPAIPRSQNPNASSSMSFSVRLRSQLTDQGSFTSDTGWGCMIRSGQSLLANALLILNLTRDWHRPEHSQEERRIVSLFADDPRAPYSIHKFVEYGAEACDKHPGQWFGPSATARCIQELTNRHEFADLRVYITGDGSDVYMDSFMAVAKPDGITFNPTLILVGTRLGIDKVTPAYWEALKSSLKMPQSVGIAGGRPSSSHYFIGVQGSYFFYLDPHQTRVALPFHADVEEYSDAEIGSCHTRRLRKLHVQEMDPSMLIGFLIRDEHDWQSWCTEIKNVPGKGIVHIAKKISAQEGVTPERDEAIDEVESFDEEDSEDDAESVLVA